MAKDNPGNKKKVSFNKKENNTSNSQENSNKLNPLKKRSQNPSNNNQKSDNPLQNKVEQNKKKNVFNKIADRGKDNKSQSPMNTAEAATGVGTQDSANVVNKAVQTAVKAATKVAKFLLRKVIILFAPLIIAFFGIIIILQLLIGPLSDAWGYFDKGVRGVANTYEKFTNMYRGFGFKNSKEAFYDELKDLDEFYDHKLNIPLLLSTIFYPESEGYDTAYEKHMEVVNGDPFTETLAGGPGGFIDYAANWLKDIMDEAGNTYDENGLVYNAGKIYRLRRLAAAMCERDDSQKYDIPLSEFLGKLGNQLSKALKDAISSVFTTFLDAIADSFEVIIKSIIDIVTLDFDGLSSDWEQYINDLENTIQNTKHTMATLLSVISFGLVSITRIHYTITGGLMVEYSPYKVNKKKYEDYLRKYYFEDTLEYNKLLPANSTLREQKKTQFINGIYRNEDTFRSIYLQNYEDSSEEYDEICLGAIDKNLVNSLRKPVNIASKSISFSSTDAYGLVNGKRHNGVNLTNDNAQVNEGDDVFAIADGTVVDVGEDSSSISTSSSTSTSSVSNYLFIGDSRYAGISNYLKSYGTVKAVSASSSTNWKTVTNTGDGMVRDQKITLPSSVSGVSVMLGVNDLNTSALEDVLNNLHSRYPDAPIYVNSVYHVGTSYSGAASNSAIDSFNDTIKSFCDSNDWATYIDVTSGLYDGDNLSSSYSSDGLHITSDEGKKILSDNIINSIGAGTSTEDLGGAYIKLSHDIDVNGTEYKFYSIYRNMDPSSVSLKKDDTVKKGDTIGKVGKTNSGKVQLYFEFRNENDTPIDPTNLFVVCTSSSSGGMLAGDSNEIKIANYLLGIGYNYVQVSAALANMFYESGYNPAAVNSSSGASGISQWLGGRKTGLMNYTSSKNSQWQDLALQLDYLRAELKNDGDAAPYAAKNYYTKIMPAIEGYDANEATKYYCNTFEVPCVNPPCSECERRKNEGKGQEWYSYLQQNVINSTVGGSGGSADTSATGDGYPEGTYTAGNGISYKQYRQDRGSWATNGYSSGTITSSGCGPTSVAILASGLVSPSITPAQTAADMGGAGNGGTNYLKLQNEMNYLGMNATVKFSPSNSDITSALSSGQVMLVSVEAATIFTGNSHLMAVVDVNSQGQVYVINPNSEGRSSSPSGWYDPSELTKASQYIITTPATRVAN